MSNSVSIYIYTTAPEQKASTKLLAKHTISLDDDILVMREGIICMPMALPVVIYRGKNDSFVKC